MRWAYNKTPPPKEYTMYFVGVLYTNSNSCSLFPCIDREQAEHKLKAIIGGRKSRKLSEDLYYVYYQTGETYEYDRVFIGRCDEDIEKTIKIQAETRDREDLEYRRKCKYKYQQKVNYGTEL